MNHLGELLRRRAPQPVALFLNSRSMSRLPRPQKGHRAEVLIYAVK